MAMVYIHAHRIQSKDSMHFHKLQNGLKTKIRTKPHINPSSNENILLNNKILKSLSGSLHAITYQYYTIIENRLTYYFVQQFRSYYAKIQNKINLKVVYEVINCVMCSADDCFNEGQYCSVSYEHGHSATGQLVLNQQLREQIMFEKYQDQWWDYV